MSKDCELNEAEDFIFKQAAEITSLRAEVSALRLRVETAEKKLNWNRRQDYCDEQVDHYKGLLDKESELRKTAEKEAAEAYAKGQREFQERAVSSCLGEEYGRKFADAIAALPIKERL